MPWKKNVWVDDDGSLTVGTPFDAAHMNNIEGGIEELGTDLAEANVTLTQTHALAASASAGAVAASGLAIGASAAAIAARAIALSASAGAVGASGLAASGVAAAGSALVTGQAAGALASSALFTGQQANTLAGSALVTGQKANALAVSASAGAFWASGAAVVASAAALNASAAIVQTNQLLGGSGMGFAFHGSSATSPRPLGFKDVLWVGTVEPTNASANDPWLNPEDFGVNSALFVPAAKVYKAAAQSIPPSTVTLLTFDTERYDNAAIHSTTSNTSRLVAPKAGVYLITVNIAWANSAVGERWLSLRKNGLEAAHLSADRRPPATDAEQALTVQTFLEAGDYVEAVAYQTTAGALNIENLSRYEAGQQFAMTWLGTGTPSPTPVDWGLVTELPAGAGVGDTCQLKVRETAESPWKVWSCVKVESSGARPWAKTGGPPLRFVDLEGRACESITNLSAGAPSFTAPFNMEALITFGAAYIQNQTEGLNEGLVVLLVNGVEAEFARFTSSAIFSVSGEMVDSNQTFSKGQVVTLRYRGTSVKKLTFARNQFKLDPSRLG